MTYIIEAFANTVIRHKARVYQMGRPRISSYNRLMLYQVRDTSYSIGGNR